MLTIYLYPKCGTCREAKKWLSEHGYSFKEIHIFDNPPSKEEIRDLWKKSGLPLKKWFNTSGEKYKELKLKDILPNLNEEEQLELLASNGRLLKRPIVTDGKKVTVGYNVVEFGNTWT